MNTVTIINNGKATLYVVRAHKNTLEVYSTIRKAYYVAFHNDRSDKRFYRMTGIKMRR